MVRYTKLEDGWYWIWSDEKAGPCSRCGQISDTVRGPFPTREAAEAHFLRWKEE